MDAETNEKLQDISLQLNDHKNQINNLEKRMSDQEKECLTLNGLALSVRELAINMTNMLDEQKRFNSRICKIEEKPERTMNLVTSTIITAIFSGVVGYLLSGIL